MNSTEGAGLCVGGELEFCLPITAAD